MGTMALLKPELKHIDVNGKLTWRQVFEYYFTEITDEQIDFILFNETCYPFDTERTLHHIYQLYKSTLVKNLLT